MEEFTIGGFIAIFEAMFGFWTFWFLILLAIVSTGLFFYFLIADKRTKSKDFLWAKWVAIPVALISIVLILWATSSTLDDVGLRMFDMMILAMVAIFSALAAAVLAYIAQSFVERKQVST